MAGGPQEPGGGEGPRGDLFAEMRRIKDASRLSYNRLAAKTHYSRSSWERFLNGKQVPSRITIEEFAAAARTDPEPLLALLDRAVARDEAPAKEPASTSAATSASVPALSSAATPASMPAPSSAARTAERPTPGEAGPSASPTVAQGMAPGASAPGPRPSGPGAPEPEGVGPGRPSSPWFRALRSAAGILAGALLGSLVTLLVIEPAGADDAAAKASPPAAPARPSAPVKVGCKSDTCLLREPQAEDCQWDAKTVRQTFLRGMSIQLRYSEACQAVWGRIENGDIGDTVVIRDKRGSSDEAKIRMEHDTYTRMLAASPDATWETITVCGAIPSQKEQECSPLGAIRP
ncbi:helix-turn-helix domain-containing protein [Streptomyces laurentii]|uniref:helix-turn-helix domain-containing protein n=1 Tax=Streptomyces laurentii TaxID=39478 RepID=UPI0036BA8F53